MLPTRSRTPLIETVLASGILAREPFALLDIGCGGGIPEGFRVFGDRLIALGVDPNLAEIARLREAEPNPGVSYVAGYAGLPPGHPFMTARAGRGWWGNNPMERLSSTALQRKLADRTDDERELTAINAWHLVSQPDHGRTWTVDTIASLRFGRPPDFVKIDVDGADLAVIVSGADTLSDPRTLGVAVEVFFHGADDPTDNAFQTINATLNEFGFALFDLSVHRYSAAALPAPFLLSIPAQTHTGRAFWGDALYLRDLAAPASARLLKAATVPEVLKLACLFDLFSMPDCAAELVMAAAPKLEGVISPTDLLDALTLGAYPGAGSHAALIETWNRHPERFFPQP